MKRYTSPAKEFSTDHEVEQRGKVRIRPATPGDIARLVEIDFECFNDAYREDPPSYEELYERFAARQQAIGELLVVGEIDGQVEGSMACQATDKYIDEFTSWEECTDNGRLTTTHDPEGRYFYVVNLAVTDRGSEVGLSNQLVANLYGRFVEQRKESVLMLSRIPDLGQWLEENGIDFETLEPEEQDKIVDIYVNTTTIIGGREVAYDTILRRMIRQGSKPVKAVREGFQDPPSHNYGVLCTYEGPIPKAIRRNRIASKMAGRALKFASQHPDLLKRFF